MTEDTVMDKLAWIMYVKVKVKSLKSCPTLCDPVDCSLPGFSVHGILRARYWSGLPFPSPGDFPNPGIEPKSLMSPALAGKFLTTRATWEAQSLVYFSLLERKISVSNKSSTWVTSSQVMETSQINVKRITLSDLSYLRQKEISVF